MLRIAAHQLFEEIVERRTGDLEGAGRPLRAALEGMSDEEPCLLSIDTYVFETVDVLLRRVNLPWRRLLAGDRLACASAQGIAGLAALLSGRSRSLALRDEWRSHLAGETGPLTGWRAIRAALGFMCR